jgi:hypothetical protein
MLGLLNSFAKLRGPVFTATRAKALTLTAV